MEVEYLQVAEGSMIEALMVERQPGMKNEISEQRGSRLLYMIQLNADSLVAAQNSKITKHTSGSALSRIR